jgi:hypothetical protein
VPCRNNLFPVLKQNFGSKMFRDYCCAQTFLTRWLVKEDTGFCSKGKGKQVSRYEKAIGCDDVYTKSRETGQQLNLNLPFKD